MNTKKVEKNQWAEEPLSTFKFIDEKWLNMTSFLARIASDTLLIYLLQFLFFKVASFA